VILLGFAGKPHDEVARDGDARHDLSRLVDQGVVFRPRVPPPHGLKDTVGTGLGRHVQVFADRGQIPHRPEDRLVKGRRVAGDEAEPAQGSTEGVEALEQIGQANRSLAGAPAVIADRLAQQRHLADAGVDQAADLLDDARRAAADLASADERNDAVGAELVAPPHDAHEGLSGQMRVPDAALLVEVFQGLAVGVGPARRVEPHLGGAAGGADHLPQQVQLTRATDQVQAFVARDQRLAQPLRHAAQHADDQGLAIRLAPAGPTKARVHLVLRVLADRAGVVQQRVRAAGVIRQLHARVLEQRSRQLAVQHVHLAAQGVQVHSHREASKR